MNRLICAPASSLLRPYVPFARAANRKWCDVFINHRGVDTKRNIAGLLYDRLVQHNLHPFLDNRTMEPGDKLLDSIHSAIRSCKVGVAIFSPRYGDSYYCLHELSLMIEAKKKVIPIFCDVKPSNLQVVLDDEGCPPEEVEKFTEALVEARYTVGLSFDSSSESYSDLVTRASDIVVKSLINGDDE